MEAAAILGPDKEGEDLKTERSYSAKGAIGCASGDPLCISSFSWRCRFCCPLSMGSVSLPMRRSIGVSERLAQRGAGRWRRGFLTACRRAHAAIVSDHRRGTAAVVPAAGKSRYPRRRAFVTAAGWTVGFCAFGAVGLYVLVSLVLALLPESWMEEYGKAMRP